MARRDRSSAGQPAEQPQNLEERAYIHTLTMRLTAEQYRRLRRYVTAYENRTNRRLTHQAVLEAALQEYLQRQQTG